MQKMTTKLAERGFVTAVLLPYAWRSFKRRLRVISKSVAVYWVCYCPVGWGGGITRQIVDPLSVPRQCEILGGTAPSSL